MPIKSSAKNYSQKLKVENFIFWLGLIMKQVISAISALAMKCVVNGTNGLFPEDDNSIV